MTSTTGAPSARKPKATKPKPTAPATTSPRVEPVDVFASEVHFLDHLLPAFLGLPEEMRGEVLVRDSLSLERARAKAVGLKVKQVDHPKAGTRPVLVAAFGDLVRAREHRQRVLYTDRKSVV